MRIFYLDNWYIECMMNLLKLSYNNRTMSYFTKEYLIKHPILFFFRNLIGPATVLPGEAGRCGGRRGQHGRHPLRGWTQSRKSPVD